MPNPFNILKNHSVTPESFVQKHWDNGKIITERLANNALLIEGIQYGAPGAMSRVVTRHILIQVLGSDFIAVCDRIVNDLHDTQP